MMIPKCTLCFLCNNSRQRSQRDSTPRGLTNHISRVVIVIVFVIRDVVAVGSTYWSIDDRTVVKKQLCRIAVVVDIVFAASFTTCALFIEFETSLLQFLLLKH